MENTELRLKAEPVSRSEERSRRYVFEAGREVLMDYGTGIQSTDEDFLRRVLEEFEAGGGCRGSWWGRCRGDVGSLRRATWDVVRLMCNF